MVFLSRLLDWKISEIKGGLLVLKKSPLLVVVLVLSLLISVPVFAGDYVAKLNIPISSYFARVQANPMYQLMNRASVAFGEKEIEGTEFAGLPVLSRMSVAHGGFKGADDFFELPAGDLTLDNIKSMYRYNNSVQALKLNGKQIIEWLEKSGGNFHQIDPNETEDQMLLDYGFDGHHFDIFWPITYQYDVTQPVGQRVVMAQYEGKDLTEEMEFIVMSDSYRAGGGAAFPHAVPENVVLKWDHDFDVVMIAYLNEVDGIVPELVHNWSIKPIETKGNILVRTGPEWGMPVMDYLEVAGELGVEPVDHIEYYGTDGIWGVFKIDLSQIVTP